MTLDVNWREGGARDGSSPVGSYYARGNATETQFIRVPWTQRRTACKQLVGYSEAVTTMGVTRLHRELPQQCPEEPTLVCKSARIVRGEKWLGRTAYEPITWEELEGYPNADAGEDAEGDTLLKMNIFKKAIIECGYEAIDYPLEDDDVIEALSDNEFFRFVSFREERAANVLSAPGGFLYYVGAEVNAARSIPYSVGKTECVSTRYYTWRQVELTAIPWETIEICQGKLNKTTFDGKAAGTLLLLPVKINKYTMANGLLGADIEFAMSHVPWGHNLLAQFKQGTPLGYKWVTNDKTLAVDPTPGSLPSPQKTLYTEAEFADMFVCDNP